MLKLLIADDERIIRETIFNIIDWKKHDIEVIGLCKNGIEASHTWHTDIRKYDIR